MQNFLRTLSSVNQTKKIIKVHKKNWFMIKLIISERKSNTSPQYIYSLESLEVVDCLSGC